ncbi:hypothetical protein V6N13_058281 [Hibiscus sabdariffa]
MENGDAFGLGSSARIGSSSIWRNNNTSTRPMEAFSMSAREEDDEEDLKWAAIEKLPTYLRVRRGILTEEQGQSREIDIKNLGFIERRNLLERLVKIAQEDNEMFLLKLKERIDRVGLDMPTIEVRFEHLNVEAEAYVGSRALPTIFNFSANVLEGLLSYLHILPSRKKPLPILNDINGIIRPRRMTLLLGPPSSGKTTLLLALAGKLGKDLKFSGRVTYNGHGMKEFVPERTSAYISQYDVHIGEMTVRETLAFSARCQGVGPRYEMLKELSRREKEANIKPDPDIDIYMKILGLEVCADTMVGDEMRRAFGRPQAVISKETLAEKIASKTGQNIELSSRGRGSSGNIAVVLQDSGTQTFYRTSNQSRLWKQADGEEERRKLLTGIVKEALVVKRMPMKVVDATVSTFGSIFEKFKSDAPNNKANFILFLADKDPSTSLSWCPDCVRAEPVIYKKLEATAWDVALLRAYVGDRPTWRNPQHPWRVDSTFKLTGVPTLVLWDSKNHGIAARLEDHEAHLEHKTDELLSSK